MRTAGYLQLAEEHTHSGRLVYDHMEKALGEAETEEDNQAIVEYLMGEGKHRPLLLSAMSDRDFPLSDHPVLLGTALRCLASESIRTAQSAALALQCGGVLSCIKLYQALGREALPHKEDIVSLVGSESGLDTKREVIEQIYAAWIKAPHLRFGQLIVNALDHGTCPGVYHIQDQELADRVEQFVREKT